MERERERDGAMGARDGKKNAYATACNSGAAVEKRRGEKLSRIRTLRRRGGAALEHSFFILLSSTRAQARGEEDGDVPRRGRGRLRALIRVCWLLADLPTRP